MAVWFFQRMEGNIQTEVGPLRPSELLSLVRKGEVKPETMLRKDDSAWFAARTVGGLFEAAVKQELHYFCPGCNKRVKEPPVTCPSCLRDIPRGAARVVNPSPVKGMPPVEAPDSMQETEKSVQSWLQKKVAARRQKK